MARRRQALLRELGDRLVDIHGQHAHQSLLHAAAQRQLLDAYAGLRAECAGTGAAAPILAQHIDQLASLQQAGDDRASRLDYLGYQIRELEDVAIGCDDLADLEAEQARLAHAERLLGDSATVLAALGDDEPSIAARWITPAVSCNTRRGWTRPCRGRDLLETAGIQIEGGRGAASLSGPWSRP